MKLAVFIEIEQKGHSVANRISFVPSRNCLYLVLYPKNVNYFFPAISTASPRLVVDVVATGTEFSLSSWNLSTFSASAVLLSPPWTPSTSTSSCPNSVILTYLCRIRSKAPCGGAFLFRRRFLSSFPDRKRARLCFSPKPIHQVFLRQTH